MSVTRVGHDSGTWQPGPVITKYRGAGDTQEKADEGYGSHPRSRLCWMEDFDGPLTVETRNFELFSAEGAANEFVVTTAASSTGSVMVDFSGFLLGVQLIAEEALATSDTNYLTFTLTNNGQSGAGTTAMLDATADANTTKATGGTAITAETGRNIAVSATAANLRVASGDLLTFTGTVTGTLANNVAKPAVRLRFATLPPTGVSRTTKTVGLLAAQPVSSSANGEALFQLGSTDEANVTGRDWGNQVTIDPTARPIFQCLLKVSAAMSSVQRCVFGLASAYNATFNSVVSNAWFRIDGGLDATNISVYVETDDGTTDTDDTDTTFDLTADTYYLFTINMRDTANISFWIDEDRKVTLSASALAAANLLQPVCWLQKDSGTGTPSITLDHWRCFYDR